MNFVFNVVIWVLGDAEMLLAFRLRHNVKVVCYSRLIMDNVFFLFYLVGETDWTPLFIYLNQADYATANWSYHRDKVFE